MKSRTQWVVWGRRKIVGQNQLNDDGKLDKLPFNPRTGGGAMSNNPTTWTSFDVACKTFESGKYNGIGFMFAEGDNLVGIDLDHCLDTSTTPPIANQYSQEIVSHFPNTYIEISPSDDGLHVYCFGLAHHCGKGSREKWIELYGKDIAGHRSHRYFCVTGNTFVNGKEISDGQAGLAWLHQTFKEVKKPVVIKSHANPRQPTADSSLFEKYVDTVFNTEISNINHAVEGIDRNQSLYDAAANLKELANSDWASPFITESQIESAILSATTLDSKEATKSIHSAFNKVGSNSRPRPESNFDATKTQSTKSTSPQKPSKHYKLGKPSHIWQYSEHHFVYQFDTKDGGEEFRPVSWDKKANKWQWKSPKGRLPIFNLTEIKNNPDKPVVICSSEKAATAAQKFCADDVTSAIAYKNAERADFSPLKGHDILVWPDNDDAGLKYAGDIVELVIEAGADKIQMLKVPPDLPEKWNAADAPDDFSLEFLECADFTPLIENSKPNPPELESLSDSSDDNQEIDWSWQDNLKTTQFGNYLNTKVNIRAILTKHHAWKNVICFNEFNNHVIKHKHPPYPHSPNKGLGQWTDADNEMLSMWIGESYDFEPSTDRLQSLIVAISMQNPIHPIRDYLESCHKKWIDANKPTGHATMWAEIYLGAEYSEATRLFEKTWLISAVARIFEPGCKADNVLILEGKQGLLKSTALSILAGDWFSDSKLDFTDKDSLMLIHENWIIEMPELDQLKKSESEKAKSFFGRREDKFRAPYGHNLLTRRRQCVFAGTTNTSDYLKDSTGNRRYMPIECKTIDIKSLKEDRDLIWGEAVDLYKNGEQWWYDNMLKYVQDAQDARFAEDVWQGLIEDFLENKDNITIQIILGECLKFEINRMDKMSRNRVADILRRIGWHPSTHVIIDGKRKKGWKRPPLTNQIKTN